jgi:hypothetical protein
MESNIALNGWIFLILFLIYNFVNQNIYYLYYIKNLIFNITPIDFLILINLLFIFFVMSKVKVRITFNISFN